MKGTLIHNLIEDAIKYCILSLGMKEMGIDEIGTEDSRVVNFDTIDRHVYDAVRTHIRFEAYTWEERYRILREMGRPEYALDHICRLGYLKKRSAGARIEYYEREISETMDALEKKYGKKAEMLKKRLGIDANQAG